MFSSDSDEESFPPLEKQTDTQTRITSKPFVQSPVTASGQPEEPRQYEAILNWQTKNASNSVRKLTVLPIMSLRQKLKLIQSAITLIRCTYISNTGILMATETVDPSTSTPTPIVDDNPSDQASQTDPVR